MKLKEKIHLLRVEEEKKKQTIIDFNMKKLESSVENLMKEPSELIVAIKEAGKIIHFEKILEKLDGETLYPLAIFINHAKDYMSDKDKYLLIEFILKKKIDSKYIQDITISDLDSIKLLIKAFKNNEVPKNIFEIVKNVSPITFNSILNIIKKDETLICLLPTFINNNLSTVFCSERIGYSSFIRRMYFDFCMDEDVIIALLRNKCFYIQNSKNITFDWLCQLYQDEKTSLFPIDFFMHVSVGFRYFDLCKFIDVVTYKIKNNASDKDEAIEFLEENLNMCSVFFNKDAIILLVEKINQNIFDINMVLNLFTKVDRHDKKVLSFLSILVFKKKFSTQFFDIYSNKFGTKNFCVFNDCLFELVEAIKNNIVDISILEKALPYFSNLSQEQEDILLENIDENIIMPYFVKHYTESIRL